MNTRNGDQNNQNNLDQITRLPVLYLNYKDVLENINILHKNTINKNKLNYKRNCNEISLEFTF